MMNWGRPGLVLAAGTLALGMMSTAQAAGKIAIDETRWISVGGAARASFASIEDAAPNGNDRSTDFNLDSARLYVNGQIHKYVKFELNTECVFCGNSGLEELVVLDAIAKFEFSPMINIWAGRLLVPAERQELNGPYYSTTYDAYRTPFFPADFSVDFGSGGAGVYARDQGVVLWGAAGPEGALQYSAGVFNGIESSSGSGPNQEDSLLYAGRLAYNFLSVESNPGYYTSGTYYGGAGDIFTIGVAMQYQEDGSGSFANPGDFFGMAVDVLYEKAFDDKGVLTVNGEFKSFDSDYASAAFTDGTGCFCMFDGQSYSAAVLYLLPQATGIGRIQPYVRYTDISPDDSTDRDEIEAGLNYIIDGHNTRISLFYQHGDIASKGLNYAPGVTGSDISAIKLAFQVQL